MNAPRPPSPEARYIVGIGASAGGLEAMRDLFGGILPAADLTFVVVHHLAPDHETLMPELLRGYTEMPVSQAVDKATWEANHVYVIPPHATLAIDGERFVVEPATEAWGRRTPIDLFFKSLAASQGDRATCIVLSGTGNDGTVGLRAIKEAGGLTIVQSPESAKYDGMPKSAIASGLVDFILDARDIPKKLVACLSTMTGDKSEVANRLYVEAASQLGRICKILQRKMGHDFSDYKQSTLIRRLQRRMAMRLVGTGREYVELLNNDKTEVKTLFADFLIGVTFFFRDPDCFHYVREHIITKICQEAGRRGKIRVWVAGCATGEEAYSFAILFREQIERLDFPAEVTIFATDIDEKAINVARTGRYPESIAEQVPEEYLCKYFTKSNAQYVISKTIRDLCLFSSHDLIQDPPFAHIDFLSCRNLLIYLNQDLQKQILPIFNYSLKADRYLLLGTSENVSSYPDGFKEIDKRRRIYSCRKPHLRPAIPVHPGAFANRNKTLMPTSADFLPPKKSFESEIQKIIVEKVSPPSVVISHSGEMLYMAGDVERFIRYRPGLPNFNLFQQAREEIRHDVRTAVTRALRSQTKIFSLCSSPTGAEGAAVNLEITVRQVQSSDDEETYLIVSFLEKEVKRAPERKKGTRKGKKDEEFIATMESELAQARAHLQATVEESESTQEQLKSSNEELLSTNEELQSTNEELQTSQQELQSVNEELETVNSELHMKVEELDKANSDLQNLFSNIRVAAVFLDNNLRIQKCTPEFGSIIRISESDVGRPITDFAFEFENINLKTAVEDVLEKLATKELEIKRSQQDQWHILRIAPYRSIKNVIDGAVITLSDVTKIKGTERVLKERTADALEANRVKNVFLANVSHEIRTPISAISGFVELLKEDLEAGQTRDVDLHIDKIKSNADLLQRMIGDLLDVTKIEAGKLDLEKKRFSIQALCESLSAQYGATARSKKLGFEFRWDGEIAPVVRSDKLRINQIFSNLLNNAVKYTDDGEVLFKISLLSRDQETQELEFSVIDTGEGIPEKIKSRVFEVFERGRKSDSNISGTGIGLFLVRNLVHLLGGEIALRDNVARPGSTFTVTFTFEYCDSEGPAAPTKTLGLLEEFRGVKILLVEDNRDLRLLNSSILARAQIAVDTAENGAVAVEMARRSHYEVVLMDLVMPELDGFETTQLLRESDDFTGKIIALTAHAMKGERERCLGSGFDGFLSKPINRDMLILEIRRLLQLKIINDNEIIYVEDDEVDLRAFKRYYNRSSLKNKLLSFSYGEKLVEYLERVKAGKTRMPAIVLLDINLSGESGLGILEQIRSDSFFTKLPIIGILTSSGNIDDIHQSLNFGANGYKQKPSSEKEYLKFLNSLIPSD